MITVKYHVFTSFILIDMIQCMKLGMQQSLILYYIYCDLVYVLKHAEVTAVHFIVTLPDKTVACALLHCMAVTHQPIGKLSLCTFKWPEWLITSATAMLCSLCVYTNSRIL